MHVVRSGHYIQAGSPLFFFFRLNFLFAYPCVHLHVCMIHVGVFGGQKRVSDSSGMNLLAVVSLLIEIENPTLVLCRSNGALNCPAISRPLEAIFYGHPSLFLHQSILPNRSFLIP